jgi:hypothetical protein
VQECNDSLVEMQGSERRVDEPTSLSDVESFSKSGIREIWFLLNRALKITIRAPTQSSRYRHLTSQHLGSMPGDRGAL